MDPAGSEPEGRPVVLVVDDDDMIRQLFATGLTHAGMQPVQAANGEEALSLLGEHDVDVVLLDSRMPVLDGFTTLTRIRATPRFADVSVIFVSGGADVADRVAGLDAGADDYLQKPLHMDELVARVRAHLRGRNTWRRRLEDSLRRRGRVAQELGKVRLGGSPEEAADSICDCLLGLEGGTSVLLVAMDGQGSATVLGAKGDRLPDLPAGRRVPQSTTSYLRDRMVAGPWVERRDAQPAGAVGVPLGGPELPAAAYVPLAVGDEHFGLLVLGVSDEAAPEGDAIAQILPAAMDFAPLVSALLAPRLTDREELERRRGSLRRLIVERAFSPVFQPIIDIERRVIVGYEALTRFRTAAETQRCFLEAAQLGMGLDLEAATARASIEASADLPEGIWLSLNVSPAFLTSPLIRDVLRDPPRPVVLELTEHDPISDYDGVLRAMDALDGDARLSVDDAGAGYACLHHILALRPAFVKLDRGWVTGIEQDPARQALVAGLCAFADRTDGHVIAEGVEEVAELATLTDLQVPLGQGYLFGRPAAAAEHNVTTLPDLIIPDR